MSVSIVNAKTSQLVDSFYGLLLAVAFLLFWPWSTVADTRGSPFRAPLSSLDINKSSGNIRISIVTVEGRTWFVLEQAKAFSAKRGKVELFRAVKSSRNARFASADIARGVLALRYLGRHRAFLIKVPLSDAHLIKSQADRNIIQAKIAMVPNSYPLRCASEPLTVGASLDNSFDASPALMSASTGYRTVDLATFADYEFYAHYLTDTDAQIQAIINSVRTIYESQLGLTVDIVSQTSSTSQSGQPFSSSTSDTLLSQFQNYVNSNPATGSPDINHLFTGKDLESSVVGLSYLGVICQEAGLYSYGISQRVPEAVQWIVTAHELGHNLNANHTPVGQGIMSPSIDTSDNRFTSTSITQIVNYTIAHGSCLTADSPSVNVLASLSGGTRFKVVLSSAGIQTGQSCVVSLYGSPNRSALTADPVRGKLLKSSSSSSNRTLLATVSRGASSTRTYYFLAKISCNDGATSYSPIRSVTSKNRSLLASITSRIH